MKTAIALAALLLGGTAHAQDFFDFAAAQRLRQTQAGGAEEAGDSFGAALATGDLDGDGLDDLVIGAPGENAGLISNAGVVFVFLGSPSGLVGQQYLFGADAGDLNEADDALGTAVAVGDFDADGYDDIAVGGPGEDAGAGAVYVWSGGPSGIDPASGVAYRAADLGCGETEAGDAFGSALASARVVGGGDELVIGADSENDGAGLVCIAFGQAGGLAPGTFYLQDARGALSQVPEAGDAFGHALALGDYDGDGVADLFASAPFEDIDGEPFAGNVATLLADPEAGWNVFPTGFTFDARFVLEEPVDAGDYFGIALAASEDGRIAVGATGYGSFAGSVFVGSPVALAYRLDQSDAGSNGEVEAGDRFGSGLAWGDFDRDPVPDLVVGSTGEGLGAAPAESGAVFFFPSSAGGQAGSFFSEAQLPFLSARLADEHFGAALAVGDFDGDGADELAIGAPGDRPTGGVASGVVFVVPEAGASTIAVCAVLALRARQRSARRRRARSESSAICPSAAISASASATTTRGLNATNAGASGNAKVFASAARLNACAGSKRGSVASSIMSRRLR